ncbi:MAG: hypothetical protein WC777_00795 [Candidatus Gracilibacteria bacterium]|jgi:hypothetical protein
MTWELWEDDIDLPESESDMPDFDLEEEAEDGLSTLTPTDVMGIASASDAPIPKYVKSAEETNAESTWFKEEEEITEAAWFAEGEKMETSAPKTSWLSKITSKVQNAVKRVMSVVGEVLDKSTTPVLGAAGLATIAVLGTGIQDFNTESSSSAVASTSVETPSVAAPELFKTPVLSSTAPANEPAKTLWETQSDAKSVKDLLTDKHAEIMQAAGGSNAEYLYSAEAYQSFVSHLPPSNFFQEILNHPEVQKAQNIGQMVNLVDENFGSDAADRIEANAAAMHLSAEAIAQLSQEGSLR